MKTIIWVLAVSLVASLVLDIVVLQKIVRQPDQNQLAAKIENLTAQQTELSLKQNILSNTVAALDESQQSNQFMLPYQVSLIISQRQLEEAKAALAHACNLPR